MDNLTFEFMERTKNIPTPPYTAQLLYRFRSLFVFVWILAGGIYTSFVFMSQFLLFFVVGISLLIALCTPRRPFWGRWEQIYSLGVIYCFIPFGSPPTVYIFCAILAILFMEFFFVRLNGYFFNIPVFILCFATMLFPTIFLISAAQPFLFIPNDVFFFLGSFPTYIGDSLLHSDLPTLLFGLFPYSPAGVLGLLGLLVYILPFIPKIIYRSSFSYIIGICLFSYVGCWLINHYGYHQVTYGIFLSRLFMQSSIVFTALFLMPETLGNPGRFRHPISFAMTNAFFTVLCYIVFPFFLLSSIIGFLLSFLLYHLVESFLWTSNVMETSEQ